MVDKYGLTIEDYVNDLRRLSNTRYTQGSVLYTTVLEAMAEAFPSHCCHLDGI